MQLPCIRLDSRAARLCIWSALACAFVVCSCRAEPSAATRPLEIVVPTDLATLDPRYATRSLDIKLTRLIHAGLVRLDPDSLEPTPLLADHFRQPDALTLDVELRRGLRFHSGHAFSAEDVCATLHALADPKLKSPHRAVVRAILSCEVASPTSLRIRLREPRATLLTDLEVPILRADEAALLPRPSGDLDGLGPYRIVRSDTASVELVPADGGAFPKPKHGAIVRSVRDENARALRLLAGRADIAPNAISPSVLPALEGRDLEVHAEPGANVTYLLFQNDRPALAGKSVRHAIARAIDRARIVRYLLANRAQVAASIFPSGHWSLAHSPRLEPFDPDGARPILSALPPLTLLTSTERERVTIARSIAQMLGDAGLPVRVIPLDFGVLLTRLDAGDFELATLQMPELTEPNLLKWFFHPDAVPGEGGEGKNRARYRSPAAGRLLDEASRSGDMTRRRDLYTQFAELLADDMPVVPLWHEDQVAVISKRAQGFHLSAEGRWLALAALP